jgi:hypothetical protein
LILSLNRCAVAAILSASVTISALAALPADFKALLAKIGATSAGQTVYQATVYCQQPPATLLPPDVIEGYKLRAKTAFSADPNYDADFATGFGDTTIMRSYEDDLKLNAAGAQETRANSCGDLIGKLPSKPYKH